MTEISLGKNVTSEKIERLILEEASQDSQGLWEICWTIRTDFCLKESDAELGAAIEPIMRSLVHRGLVELYLNQWIKKEFLPVSKSQIDGLLADKINWSIPPTDIYYSVWCRTTDEGKHLLDIRKN
jgi:hypothetical protein